MNGWQCCTVAETRMLLPTWHVTALLRVDIHSADVGAAPTSIQGTGLGSLRDTRLGEERR